MNASRTMKFKTFLLSICIIQVSAINWKKKKKKKSKTFIYLYIMDNSFFLSSFIIRLCTAYILIG